MNAINIQNICISHYLVRESHYTGHSDFKSWDENQSTSVDMMKRSTIVKPRTASINEEEEEEMPDHLEMRVQSETGENLDCVCEVVGQDPKTKHYKCRYQVKQDLRATGQISNNNGDVTAAAVVHGEFDINLPYVKATVGEVQAPDPFAHRKRLT